MKGPKRELVVCLGRTIKLCGVAINSNVKLEENGEREEKVDREWEIECWKKEGMGGWPEQVLGINTILHNQIDYKNIFDDFHFYIISSI